MDADSPTKKAVVTSVVYRFTPRGSPIVYLDQRHYNLTSAKLVQPDEGLSKEPSLERAPSSKILAFKIKAPSKPSYPTKEPSSPEDEFN